MPTVNINQQPEPLTPAYNLSYFQVNSPQSTKQQFNFIFDVYPNTYTSGYTRIISPAGPDGNCNFSPFSILKDYVGFDSTHNVTGITQSSYCALIYKINIGVQYTDNVLTGITQYPALETFTGLTWNSALRYEQFANYNYSDWLPVPGQFTSNFLTNMPDEVLIQNNEMASLSIIGYPYTNSSEPFGVVQIKVYQNSGGTTSYNVFAPAFTLPGQVVCHFGSGIWNLNQLTSGDTEVLSGEFPIFNPNTDYKYTIIFQYYNGGISGPLTKYQTYVLDCPRQPYNPVRLMWLNPLGVMDFYSFKLVSRLNDSITRNTFKQNLYVPNYQIGDRGTTITYNDIQEGMTLTSDWVRDNYSQWLEDLFNSPQVYLLNPDGTIYPITLTDTQYEVKRYQNDQTLVNYTINIQFAYKVNVQQGSGLVGKFLLSNNGGPVPNGANYKNRGGFQINLNNTPF